MLVTRSSPDLAWICLIVPVTWPAALTETSVAGGAAQLLVVLRLEAGLADQVHAGEAGHRQVRAAASPAR